MKTLYLLFFMFKMPEGDKRVCIKVNGRANLRARLRL